MRPDPLPPLVVEFEVAAAPSAAFALWVDQTARWWPAGHTVSGDPAAITFEPHVGGRIVERAPDGTEHLWGTIEAWDPPHALRYRWHLLFDPSEATIVDLSFRPSGNGTAVRLEQHGWEALGDQGPTRRERTTAGWAAVTQPYRVAADATP